VARELTRPLNDYRCWTLAGGRIRRRKQFLCHRTQLRGGPRS